MALDLETRVAKIEAAEEIKNLKARYAKACDDGYDADRIAECFTEDAVWDGRPAFGRQEGKQAIHKFFSEVSAHLTFALHYMIGPKIEVADDLKTATGTWYLLEPCILDGEALWIAATYEDQYRREEDGWKVSDLKLHLELQSPHDKGWVRQRFPDGQ